MPKKLTAVANQLFALFVCGIVAVSAPQLAQAKNPPAGTLYVGHPEVSSVILPQFIGGVTPVTVVATLNLPAGSYYMTATVIGTMYSPNSLGLATSTLYCDLLNYDDGTNNGSYGEVATRFAVGSIVTLPLNIPITLGVQTTLALGCATPEGNVQIDTPRFVAQDVPQIEYQ
jgi:hypothetical protein